MSIAIRKYEARSITGYSSNEGVVTGAVSLPCEPWLLPKAKQEEQKPPTIRARVLGELTSAPVTVHAIADKLDMTPHSARTALLGLEKQGKVGRKYVGKVPLWFLTP